LLDKWLEFDKQSDNQLPYVLEKLLNLENLEKENEQLKEENKRLVQLVTENALSNINSPRIKELKEINHSLTNELGLAQSRTQAAYASTQYYSSKLDLAHKILDRSGVLCNQLEFAPDIAKLIKEYVSFEHSNKDKFSDSARKIALLEQFYKFIDSEEKAGKIANINYDLFYPLLEKLRELKS